MKLFSNINRTNHFEFLPSKMVKKYNKIRPKDKQNIICHAPFKSLTFFLGGKVMACWHNKQFLIGEFPKNSIQEIWFGKRLKKLREHILHNDLTLGCFECKKNIENGLYSSSGSWKYDYLPHSDSEFPVSMDFQTCNHCNNECIMCIGEYSSSIRKNREKKANYQNPYKNSFIEQLVPFIPYLKEASFSGGEVFLCEEYFTIWEKFIQLNPQIIVSVTTNGTILNERVKKILEALRFNINLSIDAINKTVFEKIRKNSNLEQVLSSLNYFENYVKSKNTELTVRINVMQQNYEYIPKLITFLNDRNIKIHFNKVIFPPYAALWNADLSILSKAVDLLYSINLKTDTFVQKTNNQSLKEFIDTLKQWNKLAENYKQIKKQYINYNNDELMYILIEKLKFYLQNNKCFEIHSTQKFIELINTAFVNSFKEIDSIILKNAFIYYISMPINRLVDEFNIRTEESIIEFTRQAGIREIIF